MLLDIAYRFKSLKSVIQALTERFYELAGKREKEQKRTEKNRKEEEEEEDDPDEDRRRGVKEKRKDE